MQVKDLLVKLKNFDPKLELFTFGHLSKTSEIQVGYGLFWHTGDLHSVQFEKDLSEKEIKNLLANPPQHYTCRKILYY